MDHKASTKKALERYYEKLAVQDRPTLPRRENNKPELIVQKAVHQWLEDNGFFAFRVESAASIDQMGNTLYSRTDSGVSDELAIHRTGLFVAVECKAPGCRVPSKLRPDQADFLIKVISQNGFAVVTDSVSHLSKMWTAWNNTPDALRKSLLMRDLPLNKHNSIDDGPLFKTE